MPNGTCKELVGYRAVIAIPVLWGDMDAFGHVNNTGFIRWMESSRIRFLEEAGFAAAMQRKKWGPILAAIECNYRRQVAYPDTIMAGARVLRIGRSSIIVQHRIVSEEAAAVVADGESRIVMFDYDSQRPIRVSDEVRAAISAYEQRPFPVESSKRTDEK